MATRVAMDHHNTHTPSCPFCPFSDADGQFVAEHVAFCHPEGAIPFKDEPETQVPDQPSPGSQTPPQHEDEEGYTENYVDCPHGCGEIVADSDLPSHLDLHLAEEIALEDTGIVQTESPSVDQHDHKFDEFLEDKYAPPQKGRDRKEISQRTAPQKDDRPRSSVGSVPANGVRRLGVRLHASYCIILLIMNVAR